MSLGTGEIDMRRVLCVMGVALVAALAATSAAQGENLANVRAVLPFEIPNNPCTGEQVVGEIRVHYVLNLTVNGNSLSGTELLQYSARGVGQTTGAQYAGNESGASSFRTSMSNGQATATDTVTFHLTTPGAGNNLVVTARSHTTIDAHGEVTVSYDDLGATCI